MNYLKHNLSKIFIKIRESLVANDPQTVTVSLPENRKSLDHFVYLWNNSFNKPSIETERKINFSNYFEFGSSVKTIQNLSGKPDYVLENNGFGTQILIYILKIKNSDVRFELHFFQNKLFFLNYTYLNIPDIEKEMVIRALAEKHRITIPQEEVYNCIIIDKKGNGLLFENHGHFSVNFLAPNSKVSRLTQSYALENKAVV